MDPTRHKNVGSGIHNTQHWILDNVFVYRFAEAEEMGGVVSFLVSEDASYITGENFLVAGGMNARLWKKGEAKRSLSREPEENCGRQYRMSRDRLKKREGSTPETCSGFETC